VPYQALQVPVYAGSLPFVTAPLLRAARTLGIAVHVWTINDVAEMHQLLDAGVDGLMSDYPDRLLEVVNERARKTASR
jgi:glycerophosphoryl diester phosphodiesterase